MSRGQIPHFFPLELPVPERPEEAYETAWAQTAKSLNPDVFAVGLYGEDHAHLAFDFLIEKGIRQPRCVREAGDGLTDLVLRTRGPVLVGDFVQEQGSLSLTWMGAPLLAGEKLLGVVYVQCSRPGAYDRRDLALLGVVASGIACGLESVAQAEKLQWEARRSAALIAFARSTSQATTRSELFRAVAEVVPSVVKDTKCTVWSRMEETGEFMPLWRSNGNGGPAEKRESLPAYLRGIPGIPQMVNTRDVVILSDGDRGQLGAPETARLLEGRTVALVPLAAEDEVVGLGVAARSEDGGDLTARDVDLLRAVADVASLALQRLRQQSPTAAPFHGDDQHLSAGVLSTLSHEVRTPLSLISTGAELLTGKLHEPDQLKQVAELVSEGATRLTAVVDDVLEFVELRTQPVQLCPRVVDVFDVAREAIDQATGDEWRHRVVLETSGQTAMVEVDAEKLKSAVAKVVQNGINFSAEPSRVNVRVSLDGGTLKVRVSDEGSGIPREDLDRVFQPFYRRDTGQAKSAPGTGLGLTIARQLVEALGGQISLKSQSNRGTSVALTIPVNRAGGGC